MTGDQASLFECDGLTDPEGRPVVASSRRTDPGTSREAAKKVEATSAATQRKSCLQAVRRAPGQTAAEIADALGVDRHMPSRRLPELRRAGLVINGEARPCRIQGTRSMTWDPALS